MKIEIELNKDEEKELENLIQQYKDGYWSDGGYISDFAHFIIKYLK